VFVGTRGCWYTRGGGGDVLQAEAALGKQVLRGGRSLNPGGGGGKRKRVFQGDRHVRRKVEFFRSDRREPFARRRGGPERRAHTVLHLGKKRGKGLILK